MMLDPRTNGWNKGIKLPRAAVILFAFLLTACLSMAGGRQGRDGGGRSGRGGRGGGGPTVARVALGLPAGTTGYANLAYVPRGGHER